MELGERPPVDPSENVKALSEASSRRQDDLRDLQDRLTRANLARLASEMKLRAEHAKDIREIESNRLKAIREVDVLNQSVAAARAEAAIQTLAATTSANAELLRTTLATTERTLAAQTAREMATVNERIGLLERSLSSGAGGSEALSKARQQSLAIISAIIGTAGIAIALIFKLMG